MFINKLNFRSAALAIGLAILTSSTSFAAAEHAGHCHIRENGLLGDRVVPAQANYQDETTLAPVVGDPIPFTTRNFRNNVDVNHDKTVFEVEIPGLYSLDAYLLVNLPTVGDTVGGYITINGRQLLTFFSQETRTDGPVVEFHFNDRLVYLRKGDKVSVVLSAFTPGTTVLGRGFVMVAYNNSTESH